MSEFDTENAAFIVTDDAGAEWCLRKIREAQAEREKWRAHYEEQLRKVTARTDSTIEAMRAKLYEYYLTVPHKVARTQESYALPGGKLIFKKQQPAFDIDEEELLPWLENANREDLIKVKRSVDWAALKKELVTSNDSGLVTTIDGEVVPGIHATQRPEVFEVRMEAEG